MSDAKVEGATKDCENCKEPLVCVKVLSTWNGKTEEKLQWQNKKDNSPHFKWVAENKYNCVMPKIIEDAAMEEEEPEADTRSVKVTGPFQEAELIARWAAEKAYKITMSEVEDFSKLTVQEKSALGQKTGMLTRLLADTTIELMKIHGIKTDYNKEKEN